MFFPGGGIWGTVDKESHEETQTVTARTDFVMTETVPAKLILAFHAHHMRTPSVFLYHHAAIWTWRGY